MDLGMWEQFLYHPSIFCHPFMDFDRYVQADQLNFYTDASGNCELGMGGICATSWMMQMWDPVFTKRVSPSIEYLELYAVTATILNWIHRFANMRVIIFCDNISVIQMVNKSTSSCKCMVLVRLITLQCLIHNVRVYAKYVRSQDNEISDALSRNQMDRFRRLIANMDIEAKATLIPEQIWSIAKIWLEA